MGSEVCCMNIKPSYLLTIEYLTPKTIAIFIDGKLSSIIGVPRSDVL